MKRIAIDIHGVLDANPRHFANMGIDTISCGGEVHILTGIEWSEELERELLSFCNGVKYWTHFSSIITTLKQNGEPGYYCDKGRYWFHNDDAWDKVKGTYCYNNRINEIYDDTIQYRKYMPPTTNFFLYSHNPVEHEKKLLNPHLNPKPKPAKAQPEWS